MRSSQRWSRLSAAASLFLLALALACSKKGGSPLPTQGPGPTATLTGLTFGTNGGGLPLAGVTVSSAPSAGASATSNSFGFFSLTVPANAAVAITASHAGFATHPFSIQLTTGETRAVTLVLPAHGATVSLATASGGKVIDLGTETALTLPAAFVSGTSNAFVSVTGVDPTTDRALTMPGTFAAENSLGTLLAVEPATLAEIRIGDGADTDFPLLLPATLEMKLPSAFVSDLRYNMGDLVPCFRYDDASGHWKFIANGNVAVSSVDAQPCIKVTVTRASWVVAGFLNGANGCVSGVVTSGGLPVSGATVEAFPGGTDVSKTDGSYRVSAPPNYAVQVVASRPATGTVRMFATSTTAGGPGGMCTSEALALQNGGPAPTFTIEAQLIRGKSGLIPVDQAFVHVFANTSPAPTPLDGSLVQLGNGVTWRTLPLKAPGSGMYGGSNTFALVPGTLYTLRVDLEPDGVFDASASVMMPGKPQITAPIQDEVVTPKFNASWSDPASGAGYSARYIGSIEATSFGTFPARFVADAPATNVTIGTGIGQPAFFMPNDSLDAGNYTFRLWATNGPVRYVNGAHVLFADPNFTGASNVFGWFSAIAQADSIGFGSLGSGTLQNAAGHAAAARKRAAAPK